MTQSGIAVRGLKFVLIIMALSVWTGASPAMAQAKKPAKKTEPETRGEKLAAALPQPLPGFTARERVEDQIKTKQVRVQRIYLDAEKKPILVIMVRSETPATLKKRQSTFMDEKVVKSKKGEFKEINGQRFSILKIKGEYTAMTIIRDTYSVLYFGTKDRDTLLAYIVSTNFNKISAVK